MNTNIICNNINRMAYSPSFKSKTIKNNSSMPESQQKNKTDNSAKKYTTGAIVVIAAVGMGLLFKNKISEFFKEASGISSAKKSSKILPMHYNKTGPTIDMSKGKTAISDAWNVYISEIEERISSHKDYTQIFTNNIETLNHLEEKANQRLRVSNAA